MEPCLLFLALLCKIYTLIIIHLQNFKVEDTESKLSPNQEDLQRLWYFFLFPSKGVH